MNAALVTLAMGGAFATAAGMTRAADTARETDASRQTNVPRKASASREANAPRQADVLREANVLRAAAAVPVADDARGAGDAARIDAALTLSDVDGVARQPLAARPGGVAVVFFVAHDCPISNHYAPEIRRLCAEYATQGAGAGEPSRTTCSLVHVDPSLSDDEARAHARMYDHGPYPVIVDREHVLVRETGAATAPEAVVLTPDGRIGYRGRIDDVFVDWGSSRRQRRSQDLRAALDALLAGGPAPRPEAPPVGCIIADFARATPRGAPDVDGPLTPTLSPRGEGGRRVRSETRP